MITKIKLLKIFPQLFLYNDNHAFWNSIENGNDENYIMKSDKKLDGLENFSLGDLKNDL